MKKCPDCKSENIGTKIEWHYDKNRKFFTTKIEICGTCGCDDIDTEKKNKEGK